MADNIIDLNRQISQNFVDYIAQQFQTWVDFFFGSDNDNQDEQVQNRPFVFSKGCGYVIASDDNGNSQNIYTCDIHLAPFTSKYVSGFMIHEGYFSKENPSGALAKLNSIEFNLPDNVGLSFYQPIQSLSTAPVTVVRKYQTNEYNTIPYRYNYFKPNYGQISSYNLADIAGNDYMPHLLDGQCTFQNVTGYYRDGTGRFDSKTINNKTFSSYYDKTYGYQLTLPDTFSYNEIRQFIDYTIDQTIPNNDINFPSYDDIKPQPELDPFELPSFNFPDFGVISFPDTDEYLDTSTVADGVTSVTAVTGFFLDWLSELGILSIILFTVLICIIIKWLRGDW